MAYSVAEQETVIVYQTETRNFDVYTTVPKHIRRLLKYTSKTTTIFELKHIENDSEGNCIALRLTLEKLPSAGTFHR